MKLLRDLFKRIFTRQKQQPVNQPQQKKETPKTGGAFQPHRKKSHGRWIITVNRMHREKSKKVRKRRAKNKMARRSRKINRAA